MKLRIKKRLMEIIKLILVVQKIVFVRGEDVTDRDGFDFYKRILFSIILNEFVNSNYSTILYVIK